MIDPHGPGWSLPSEISKINSKLLSNPLPSVYLNAMDDSLLKKYQPVIDLALKHPDMTTVQLQSATGLSASQIGVILARRGIRKKKGINGRWEQTGIPYDMDPYTPVRVKKIRKKNLDALSNHPLYKVYNGMRQRCENPNYKNFQNWGGRGISVCERWKGENGFKNFIEDMGPRPEGLTKNKHSAYTLERKDNNLGYSKENCYWATWKQQNSNTRGKSHGTKLKREQGAEIRKLAAEGMNRKDLATKFNISQCTLSYIIRNIMWKDRY